MAIAAQPVQQNLPQQPLSYIATVPAGTPSAAPMRLTADGAGYVDTAAGDPAGEVRVFVRQVEVRNPNVDPVLIGGPNGAFRTIPQGEFVIYNVPELGEVALANAGGADLSVEVTLLYQEKQQ